jgi:hypothetical protein
MCPQSLRNPQSFLSNVYRQLLYGWEKQPGLKANISATSSTEVKDVSKGKVKVKVSIEQAMNAQRGSRGITLFFL